jgi:phosphoribosylglycinamide formyltransferase-1
VAVYNLATIDVAKVIMFVTDSSLNQTNKPLKKRFVILISGIGSNMQRIAQLANDSASLVSIQAVVSNKPSATGLDWAAQRGIETAVVDHQLFSGREAFDQALAEVVAKFEPDYVLLAGFMRILTPGFVNQFKGRLINVHPSLLPAFPGLHTHARALKAGVDRHGCSVHFVTDELDHGPVIAQAALEVSTTETPEQLAQRVLVLEHQLYPEVVQWLSRDKVTLDDNGRVTLHGVSYRHIGTQE